MMLSAKIVAQNPAGSVSSAGPVVQGGGVAAAVAAPTVSGRFAASPPEEQAARRKTAATAPVVRRVVRSYTVMSWLENDGPGGKNSAGALSAVRLDAGVPSRKGAGHIAAPAL